LTTSNPSYLPTLYSVQIVWNNGFKIVQNTNTTLSLYNNTGQTLNLRLDATIYGADLAEWYTENDDSITYGDVVALTGTLDSEGIPILRKTSGANDPGLIGVISTNAGQTLGIQADNRRLLALAGRVPVNMDPNSAPIHSGDALTSGSIPGTAQKAGIGQMVFARAAEDWSPESGEIQILAIVNNTTYTQGASQIVDAGLMWINGVWQAYDNSKQEAVTATDALASLVATDIQAGAIETKDLTADEINVGIAAIDKLTTNNLAVKLISPVPGETNVTVQIGSEATPSGEFVIQNASGSAVASIDNLGNATFSGTLRAGTIYADQIIGTEFATSSAQLQQIQDLLTQVQSDQNILNQAASWNVNTATSSASIANLAVSDLYITNQAAINSLSVTTNLSLGTDFVFGATNNSIDTLSAPLRIQSLAMAPVEIMDGLVTIDTKGNVNIAGDLFVAGRIKSSGLTLQGASLQGTEATSSAALLTLQNESGQEVASVNASGSAQFNSLSTPQLVIAGPDATVSGVLVNGVITTNSTIGTATIPAGTADITIVNPKVTDYTLVYVTPTSSTNNYVLYVKSKQAGQFVVGFTNPINTDVNFNWWIVQVSQ
jgi:hypothetical protein